MSTRRLIIEIEGDAKHLTELEGHLARVIAQPIEDTITAFCAIEHADIKFEIKGETL